MNLLYTLAIFIVLFAGFNFLLNSEPVSELDSTYSQNEYNASSTIEITGLKQLSKAFDFRTGNSFIDTLLTGFSVLLVIALLLFARGINKL
jgi:hypothetical protein